MVSDKKLFTALDKSKSGMINTSCGFNTLKIEGKGSIKLSHEDWDITLHNVLFVPKLALNLLSLRASPPGSADCKCKSCMMHPHFEF